MALKGLRVIEMSGLAPSPVCGMFLADFGASVTRIDKVVDNQMDVLRAGKRSLALNLKKPEAIRVMRQLVNRADVLIEPYRPGVMERLGLSPEALMKENPRLIYARLTGFGSGMRGKYADRAGHEINYTAVSGLLSMLGKKGEKPFPPVNFAADFAGGSLMCAFGICLAIIERHRSGKGQVVDCAMVEGTAYVASWLFRSRSLPIWGNERGANFLDGGNHSYDTYETKDGKYMSVGALEPHFYSLLLQGLQLDEDKVHQLSDIEKNRELFTNVFKQKTQQEWCEVFDDIDACVFPVVDWEEAPSNEHNKSRSVFNDPATSNGRIIPTPAPKLSRTPGKSSLQISERDPVDVALEVLGEIGMKRNQVKELYENNVLLLGEKSKL